MLLFLWLVLSFALFVLFHCIIIIFFCFCFFLAKHFTVLPCEMMGKKNAAISIGLLCCNNDFLFLLLLLFPLASHHGPLCSCLGNDFFFFPSRCCWISALVALVIKTANSVRNERKAPWLISLIYSLKFSSYTLKYWNSIVWTCGGVFANQTAQVIHFNKKQKWPEGNGNGDMGYDRSGRKYLFRGKLFIGRVSVTWFHSIDIFRFLNG